MLLRQARLDVVLILVAAFVTACGGGSGSSSSSSASSSSSSSSVASSSSSSSVSSSSSSSSSSNSSVSSSSSSSSSSSIALPTYHITEIVPVSGYSATPVDINENNMMVGTSRNGSANPSSIGFYWTPSGGAVTTNGNLALAVTSNNEVVTQNVDAYGNVTLTMLDPALGSATGIYQTGSSNGYPWAYSRTGAAVGGGYYWSGPTTTTSLLANLPGAVSVAAQAINAVGQIIGYATTSTGAVPVYWATPTAVPVAMQGAMGNPIAISSDGKIIGIKSGGGVTMMYYWPSPASTPVLISVATVALIPVRINKDGIFVGQAQTNTGSYAMVGTAATGPIDLATRLDASGTGWTLYVAEAINDNGVIVGYGMGPDGLAAAFVAIPN